MRLFTCKLCKAPFLAKDKPSHCPFCGAVSKHLMHPKHHFDDDFILQPKTKRFLQRFSDEKFQNLRFYNLIKTKAEEKITKHLFEALENIENRHLLVLESLEIKPNKKMDLIKTYEFDEDNITDAFHRKSYSSKFLREIIHEIDDPYVTELIAAILEVEEEHVQLLKEYM